jgi:hypothetical protein
MDGGSKLLDELTTLAWYPVILSSALVPAAFSFQHALAAPCNVFTSSNKDGILSHFLWTAMGDAELSGNLFGFQMPIQSSMRSVELFLWMTTQSKLFTNTHFMVQLYSSVLAFMKQFRNHEYTKNLIRHLERDAPFVWFPFEESTVADQWGELYPLSRVTYDDASTFLWDFPIECPVRVLKKAYHGKEPELVGLFCRHDGPKMKLGVCLVCKAAEGRFGSRGRALAAEQVQNQQPCTCVDMGFGSFVPQLPGLISESPTLSHLLSVLRVLKFEIERVHSDSSDRSKDLYNRILFSISRNIWNTFNVSNSLHPYASGALRMLREAFRAESLLPTTGGTFVPISSKCLAIDDDEVLKTDRVTSLLRTYNCISVHTEAVTSDLGTEEADYSIDRLEHEEKALLLLSEQELGCAGRVIPPKVGLVVPVVYCVYFVAYCRLSSPRKDCPLSLNFFMYLC